MADTGLYGVLEGGTVRLTDGSTGVPVALAEEPAAAVGYVARASWEQDADGIRQVWRLEPAAGSAYDATLTLAKMQAEGLSDAQALEVPALYDVWYQPLDYKRGKRVTYDGVLYKCLQDHRSQDSWAPDKSPSLWARVLPGQDGTVGEWAQPDSTNPYMKGDRVTHKGKTWESTVDNNVWEPGAQGVTQWVEVTEKQGA